MKKILLVFGTRPEAIKMAPLVKEFQKKPEIFQTFVCVTGQHRQMLDQVSSNNSSMPQLINSNNSQVALQYSAFNVSVIRYTMARSTQSALSATFNKYYIANSKRFVSNTFRNGSVAPKCKFTKNHDITLFLNKKVNEQSFVDKFYIHN